MTDNIMLFLDSSANLAIQTTFTKLLSGHSLKCACEVLVKKNEAAQ